MSERHHIILVPGFFGFANLGDLVYFSHVSEFLGQVFADAGIDARITHASTSPTASIRERVRRIAEVIDNEAGRGPLHLIGHSSGGLDIRLLTAHGFSLEGRDIEAIAGRVRTVVMLATPHHGTPLANYFTTLFGQRILALLSLATVYILRFGSLPLSFVFRLVGLVLEARSYVSRANTVIDQLFSQLLSDFSRDRRRALQDFLGEVSGDQSIIPQLSPESLELFNARASDREGVRYGSVVTRGRKPNGRTRLRLGPNPYNQATYLVYQWLYREASRFPTTFFPVLSPEQRVRLLTQYHEMPSTADNDGIVPTLSQPWGEIIEAVDADHLDIIGHFYDRSHVPPHYDWLVTGSGFNREAFERMWGNIASFVAEQMGR
ncbi:MAG: triacylglycerol lipase [Myxococcota bacterium]